eukprot:1178919-Prorocentrum_minimum.AAC.5
MSLAAAAAKCTPGATKECPALAPPHAKVLLSRTVDDSARFQDSTAIHEIGARVIRKHAGPPVSLVSPSPLLLQHLFLRMLELEWLLRVPVARRRPSPRGELPTVSTYLVGGVEQLDVVKALEGHALRFLAQLALGAVNASGEGPSGLLVVVDSHLEAEQEHQRGAVHRAPHAEAVPHEDARVAKEEVAHQVARAEEEDQVQGHLGGLGGERTTTVTVFFGGKTNSSGWSNGLLIKGLTDGSRLKAHEVARAEEKDQVQGHHGGNQKSRGGFRGHRLQTANRVVQYVKGVQGLANDRRLPPTAISVRNSGGCSSVAKRLFEGLTDVSVGSCSCLSGAFFLAVRLFCSGGGRRAEFFSAKRSY